MHSLWKMELGGMVGFKTYPVLPLQRVIVETDVALFFSALRHPAFHAVFMGETDAT